MKVFDRLKTELSRIAAELKHYSVEVSCSNLALAANVTHSYITRILSKNPHLRQEWGVIRGTPGRKVNKAHCEQVHLGRTSRPRRVVVSRNKLFLELLRQNHPERV